MKILGIDPGLRCTGWGVVNIQGNELSWLGDGAIRPDPDAADDVRLHDIALGLDDVIARFCPDMACIEEIFMAKNPNSAIKLGMAKGAAMVTVASAGLKLRHVSARRIKQNVTGSGRADKAQVSAMVGRLLGITPSGSDAADALAIAISAMNENTADSASMNKGGGLASAIAAALDKEQIR